MVESDPQRRTVLKGAAVAALASVAGSTAGGAQEAAIDDEEAAEMLREFYDGYLEGISQAVATDVHMEATDIEEGRSEPWPLEVWDDVDDARFHGITLGASEGGSQPFWDEYTSFDREFDGGDGGDGGSDDGEIGVELLETNAPVPAGETLEVTAELTNDGGAAATEVELVVGHDPTVVDSASPTVEGTETVTLTFETATVSNSQTFPVRVDGTDDSAETTVEVVGTNETA